MRGTHLWGRREGGREAVGSLTCYRSSFAFVHYKHMALIMHKHIRASSMLTRQ